MARERYYGQKRKGWRKRAEPPTAKANAGGKPEAVSYLRVSSKEQEKEGFSIPAQRKLLHDYAKAQGITVVSEFEDVETAKQSGRTRFGEMLKFLADHPTCRIVLVEKTDRLYRNIKDWVTLDEMDLEIHLVKEGEVLSKTSKSSEKFVHGIKVLMAKNYIDNLREETQKGQLEKAEQGIWPSVAPVGYRNVVGPNGKKIIEPDPILAPAITRLFERFASGKYSLVDVVKLAAEEGVTTRKGRKLQRAPLHYLLRNPLYCGLMDWRGKRYEGNHTRLVSRELWERVQEVLDGRSNGHVKKARKDFTFSGLVHCGACGCSLVGEIKKGKYVYYHCTFNRGECSSKEEPWVKEQVLEDQFSEHLAQLVIDDEIVAWMGRALRESHSDEEKYYRETVDRLRVEFDKLERRLHALYDDKLDGRITAEFYDQKAAATKAELDRVKNELGRHEKADRTYLETGARLLELLQSAQSLYVTQPAAEKRALLGYLCSNSTWKDGKLTVQFKQPFDLLAVTNVKSKKAKAAGVDSDGLRGIWLLGRGASDKSNRLAFTGEELAAA